MRLRLRQSHTGRPGESFWIFSRLGTPPMVLCMSSLAPIVSTLECSELHHGSISYSDTTHCGCRTLFNNACILGQYSTIFSLHIRKAMITILQICACGFCAISAAASRFAYKKSRQRAYLRPDQQPRTRRNVFSSRCDPCYYCAQPCWFWASAPPSPCRRLEMQSTTAQHSSWSSRT